MAPKITTLTIKGFRTFKLLSIERLGRVSLITGRNNTGKSSVLEALRILATAASPIAIYGILRLREEDALMEESPTQAYEGLFPLSSLFSGFPRFSSEIEPMTIAGRGFGEISLSTAWLPEKDGEFAGMEVPAIRVESGSVGSTHSLRAWRAAARNAWGLMAAFRVAPNDTPVLPCEFVSAYGGEQTGTLGSLWDKIALSPLEEEIVKALRIIDPNITGVSMVSGKGPGKTRVAIVRAKDVERPVPLRSFGDGMNRLFGIMLSLANAKGGLLLIDEFENGMHHTVQADAWRVIFALASRLDVQVVATSHSWDAIEAFQKAASETDEEGVLIRLTRRGDDVIPTLFSESELAVATRERIEVR